MLRLVLAISLLLVSILSYAQCRHIIPCNTIIEGSFHVDSLKLDSQADSILVIDNNGLVGYIHRDSLVKEFSCSQLLPCFNMSNDTLFVDGEVVYYNHLLPDCPDTAFIYRDTFLVDGCDTLNMITMFGGIPDELYSVLDTLFYVLAGDTDYTVLGASISSFWISDLDLIGTTMNQRIDDGEFIYQQGFEHNNHDGAKKGFHHYIQTQNTNTWKHEFEYNKSRTLFVSEEFGNNNTAKRGSYIYRYKTVGEAFKDAQGGDVIWVEPGRYYGNSVTLTPFAGDSIFLHLENGVYLINPSFVSSVTTNLPTLVISGYGDLTSTTGTIFNQNSHYCILSAKSITSNSNMFVTNSTLSVDVANIVVKNVGLLEVVSTNTSRRVFRIGTKAKLYLANIDKIKATYTAIDINGLLSANDTTLVEIRNVRSIESMNRHAILCVNNNVRIEAYNTNFYSHNHMTVATSRRTTHYMWFFKDCGIYNLSPTLNITQNACIGTTVNVETGGSMSIALENCKLWTKETSNPGLIIYGVFPSSPRRVQTLSSWTNSTGYFIPGATTYIGNTTSPYIGIDVNLMR